MDKLVKLSKREQALTKLMSLGLNYKQSAIVLGVSQKTVGTYVARIRQKLNCKTTNQYYFLAIIINKSGLAFTSYEPKYDPHYEELVKKLERMSFMSRPAFIDKYFKNV